MYSNLYSSRCVGVYVSTSVHSASEIEDICLERNATVSTIENEKEVDYIVDAARNVVYDKVTWILTGKVII